MRFGFRFDTVVFGGMLGGLLLLACEQNGPPGPPAGGQQNMPNQMNPAEDIGEPLAVVNGMVVGTKDFEKAAARTVPEDGESLSAEEKQEILDRLIAQKVLYQEALRLGLDQDPKVQKVMTNTLLRKEIYSKVRNSDFDEETLEAYFEEHRDDFVVPAKVQVKRILIRVTDERSAEDARAEAERLRAKVVEDPKDTFKEVASKYSEDPYRRRGGDVGFVSKEGKPGLDQDIVDKAFEMEEGAVSEVFQTDEGFNVIYVANRRDRVERTFQQMKGSVLRKVKNEKLKELYDKYVEMLRQNATIKVNEEVLSQTDVKRIARPFVPPGSARSALRARVRGDDEEGNEGSGAEESGSDEGEAGEAGASEEGEE